MLQSGRSLQQVAVTIFLLTMAAMACASRAQAVDLHAFWDQRCAECHGHSAQFARKFLSVADGKLVGRHHKDNLREFLGQHHMGSTEAEGIATMLQAQVTTPPIFQQKCASCHGTAAELVRGSVERVGTDLVGRPKGRRLSQFLRRHGKLEAGEVDIMLASLARVLDEVGGRGAK